MLMFKKTTFDYFCDKANISNKLKLKSRKFFDYNSK